jgi:hypothetical protein
VVWKNRLRAPLFQRQNLTHPRPRCNLSRTSSALLKPFMKRPEFHAVLDRRISRQHTDCEVLSNVLDPTALADCPQAQRDRFIKNFQRSPPPCARFLRYRGW